LETTLTLAGVVICRVAQLLVVLLAVKVIFVNPVNIWIGPVDGPGNAMVVPPGPLPKTVLTPVNPTTETSWFV
jgi:hypothetical protein